jgi:hypothetical protein
MTGRGRHLLPAPLSNAGTIDRPPVACSWCKRRGTKQSSGLACLLNKDQKVTVENDIEVTGTSCYGILMMLVKGSRMPRQRREANGGGSSPA